MGYLEAIGTVQNPDVAVSFFDGKISIDEVEAIAGKADAEVLKKYKKGA